MMKFAFGMSAVALMAVAAVHPACADGYGPGPRYYPQGVYNWAGFYIGGNVGYSWGRSDSDNFADGVPVSTDLTKLNGVIGGGQAGLNFQARNWVFGIETDFQGSGQKGSDQFISCPAAIGVCSGVDTTDNFTTRMDWFGTTRGRLGYAWDNWMLYATGGVAYARFTGTATLTCPACDPATISAAKVKAGWVVGGGVEAALAYNWTWKIEYLHADYGTINTTAELPGITNVAETRETDDIVRAGINYRFGERFSGGSLK